MPTWGLITVVNRSRLGCCFQTSGRCDRHFEAFKLSILRYHLGGSQEISRDDLLATLDALKGPAMAQRRWIVRLAREP